jgi:alpha-acetolactate decarboxylase
MTNKIVTDFVARSFIAWAFAAFPLVACKAQESDKSFEFIQYGEMHVAIGQRQHQGRVALTKIVGMPHFYGVGALASLEGEITILDSAAIITGVTRDGRLQPKESSAAKATMLAGQSIEKWTEVALTKAVSHQQFDKTVGTMAAEHGIDVTEPFVFVAEGEFTDVRLHVINGACPIRARMKKEEIDKGKRPFELEARKLKGTLVGIYAADSVGKLTHPATNAHIHMIYTDKDTGHRVTGHIEQIGLAKKAVLKLPASGEQSDSKKRK